MDPQLPAQCTSAVQDVIAALSPLIDALQLLLFAYVAKLARNGSTPTRPPWLRTRAGDPK